MLMAKTPADLDAATKMQNFFVSFCMCDNTSSVMLLRLRKSIPFKANSAKLEYLSIFKLAHFIVLFLTTFLS